MAVRDLYHNISAVKSISPAARTASHNGAGVDIRGYESATALVSVGVWTDGTHTFELQESDDDSTYTAVADSDLLGSEPVVDAADEDEQVYAVGYSGTKRYLRVVATVASATTGAIYGVTIVRGHPALAPTS